jgi:hypothetical protein
MATTATKPKLPSPAGRTALLNIAAGRGSTYGLRGMSSFGGHHGTMGALMRAGLVTRTEELTEAGRAMVLRLRPSHAKE